MKINKHMHLKKIILPVVLSILFLGLAALAIGSGKDSNEATMTGEQIATAVFNRENGQDAEAQMQMTLISKSEKQRVREFTIHRKDDGPLSRQLIRFTAPADIKGTGFLTIEKPAGEAEQFLYLPSLRRSRRIVSSQKSHRFVNSDLTYEDMERRPVEHFTHQFTGQEKIGNMLCDILESRPKPGVKSQYGKLITWVTPKIWVPVQIHYYDEKDRLFKKYRVLKLKKIQNIWTETMVSMEDVKRKHKTVLTLHNISYNIGIEDSAFTRKRLEND